MKIFDGYDLSDIEKINKQKVSGLDKYTIPYQSKNNEGFYGNVTRQDLWNVLSETGYKHSFKGIEDMNPESISSFQQTLLKDDNYTKYLKDKSDLKFGEDWLTAFNKMKDGQTSGEISTMKSISPKEDTRTLPEIKEKVKPEAPLKSSDVFKSNIELENRNNILGALQQIPYGLANYDIRNAANKLTSQKIPHQKPSYMTNTPQYSGVYGDIARDANSVRQAAIETGRPELLSSIQDQTNKAYEKAKQEENSYNAKLSSEVRGANVQIQNHFAALNAGIDQQNEQLRQQLDQFKTQVIAGTSAGNAQAASNAIGAFKKNEDYQLLYTLFDLGYLKPQA